MVSDCGAAMSSVLMKAHPRFSQALMVTGRLKEHRYLLLPKRKNNDKDTPPILSFSAGGTRAAALSYGMLEELRHTNIVVDGKQRRLMVTRSGAARRRHQGESRGQPSGFLEVVSISFDEITNPEERAYFMSLPTSFSLPPEAIEEGTGALCLPRAFQDEDTGIRRRLARSCFGKVILSTPLLYRASAAFPSTATGNGIARSKLP